MKKLKSIALSSALVLGAVTYSNANANEIEVVSSLTATSNYISRGMTQTNDKGAVFGEVTAIYGGFFGGIWASNVEFEGADANSEIDLYLGYATNLGPLETTLSYTRFFYPNSDDIPYLDEVALELVYPMDKLSVGGKYIWGTYTENDGETFDYYEGFASYDFDVVTLHGSAGSIEDIGDNFIIGVSKEFELSTGGLSLDLSYTQFDAKAGSGDDQEHLYATITYTF